MTYRLLLDENVEVVLSHRLRDAGHDVTHVNSVPELGKSADDLVIAAYSSEVGRILLTYDDDFVMRIDESAFHGVLYFPDASLRTAEVAAIVDELRHSIRRKKSTGSSMRARSGCNYYPASSACHSRT